jgi:prophage maintenance system killer protein
MCLRNFEVEEKVESKGEILIYQTDDYQSQIEVRLENETVWLTQKLMAELFRTSTQNITIHIGNIYSEGELTENSTCKDYLQVQKEGNRVIERTQKFYNLDVIISVGYRVKSKRGTQFRIWATKTLKEFLVRGFVLNEKLLKAQAEKLKQLNDTIQVISAISLSKYLKSDDKDNFLMLLERFSTALNILDDYDYNRINKPSGSISSAYKLEYDEVKIIIQKMKSEIGNSEYFGKEKDESLKSSISAIYQTFGGFDLYPMIIEKAVNLLYFLVKNHSFIDGNKRIAAAIFIYFLDKNNILNNSNLSNDLLVTITLMIANSKSSDKEIIVNIVAILLNKM